MRDLHWMLSIIVWCAGAAQAGETTPDPVVALIEKADAAFTGCVKNTDIGTVKFGAEEAAALNADPGLRRLPGTGTPGPLLIQAGKTYHLLCFNLLVDNVVKGDVQRGSVLRTKIALAEDKNLVETFNPGWAESPSEGRSIWEAEAPGGRLFVLKAEPGGLSFRPVLLDFPADTPAAAARKRQAALAAVCRAFRGRPGFALPEILSNEEILSRLRAKVEKLDGGRVRLTYDFSQLEQLHDWYVINTAGDWRIENGKLVQMSNEGNNEQYMATVLATCAGFTGDVEATFKLTPVDNDCFSVHIAHYSRTQNYTFLMNSDYGKTWEARRVIGPRLRDNADRLWVHQGDYDPGKLYTINMGRRGGTIFVKLDGKLLFATEDVVLTGGSVALGCKGQTGIRYDSVVIEGEFDGRWTKSEPAAPTARHPAAPLPNKPPPKPQAATTKPPVKKTPPDKEKFFDEF